MKKRETRSIITNLRPCEEKFVQLLIEEVHFVEAYIVSHNYEYKTNLRTMEKKASLLRNSAAVKIRYETLHKKLTDKYIISKDYIVENLKKIVEAGVFQPITNGVLNDSSGANSALDKLTKIAGFYAPEKSEAEIKTKGRFIMNMKEKS